jgi:serine/threonine-protein kinase
MMSNYLFEDSDSDTTQLQTNSANSDATQLLTTPSAEQTPPQQPQQQSTKQSAKFADNLTVQYVIGEGAVGRVYFAYDEALGRRVAIKELLDNTEQLDLSEQERQRLEKSFIHEAKITGKLEHPGIIPVYQLSYRPNAGAYYVMRYVKGGETLEAKINKIQLSPADQIAAKRIKLIDTLIAACDAVAYAHSKGVIHRDLKPSNIISGQFGETMVLDWGLAQVLRDSDDDFFSSIHHHQQDTYSDNTLMDGVGTPRYMAPEQLSGKANRTSDVYSLGVILFKILTGSFPYKGSSEEIEAKLLSNDPSPSPNAYTKSISPELCAICEKAMAKNPDDRFSNAGELAEQLKAYRDGRMVNIYTYSRHELLRRFIARNKPLVFMVTIVLITILMGAAFSVHYAIQMDKARAEAEKSLVSVTGLGDQAQAEAGQMATAISAGVELLFADMKKTVAQLNSQQLSANKQRQDILNLLHAQYPDFISFTVENSNALQVNFGWKAQVQQFEEPVLIKENGKLLLMFLVPLQSQDATIRYLVGKALPEQVLPKFFSSNAGGGHLRDIWLMRDDGLIVYDKEAVYRGTNIFTDAVNTQSPSIVAFAQIVADKPSGIGYYFFANSENHKVSKIAAWQTLLFAHKSWKIIVDYTYMISHD